MPKTAKELTRLRHKVRILEEMLENSSRDAYLESQRRQAANALLRLSLREPNLDDLLRSSLEILLAVEFLAIEDKGAIFIANEDDTLTLAAQQNFNQAQQDACHKIPFGYCLCGRAALGDKAIICPSSDARHENHYEGMPAHGHCCLPLRDNNKPLGVLCLYLPNGADLSAAELDFLSGAANIIANTIQRYRYRQTIAAYQSDLEEMVEAKVRELCQAELALEAEKERLLVTLRSIGDGVISTDAQGRISMLNKVAEHLTGWRQDEAQGRPLTEVFHIINEKTRDVCDNPVEKVLQSGLIVGLANHTALIAKDGSERIIADSGSPIRDRNSEIIGVVLVFRDITRSSRMEEELRRKRQLESLGVLAGGIAHDFNNILTAILGNINLAEYIVKDDQKAAHLLEEADKASHRAAALVQQLLTFSKGGAPIKGVASLAEIIKGTTDFIMRGSNIGCDYQFADDLSPAEVDAGQIGQVIQNLVINARQAMPEGGTITISCHNYHKTAQDSLPLKNGDYLMVAVKDEGSGISLSRLEHIFDPYFTTKKSGNGLGLAIVHSIINKHDGYITVTSKLGHGTTFSFYLPASEQTAVIPARKDGDISADGRGTILVMDDEEMIRDTTSQMLHILGYETVQVGTGQEAVSQYRAAAEAGRPFRAVVMDLTIAGGMGGKETVRQILQCRPDAKVLVASGYGNDPILANPGAYGFAASLVKPFAMDDLARVLNNMLSK